MLYPVPRARVTAADGLLLVDKPVGISSHDVVSRVRRLAATKKVGHGGTLDPLASGLLVVGIGKGTKLLSYLLGHDKAYEAVVRLGIATDTDDIEGKVISSSGCPEITYAKLETEVSKFRGEIKQVPASVSAIKVDGKRAYDMVRAGQEVELAARPVTIHGFEILDFQTAVASVKEYNALPENDFADIPVVDFSAKIGCSAGTYIRSLARDLGQNLAVGGHLTALRRTLAGPFGVEEAQTIPELKAQIEEDNRQENPQGLKTISLTRACARLFPLRQMGAEAENLRYGKRVSPSEQKGIVAALDTNGQVVALIKNRAQEAQPVLVFNPA
ncbi:tRNA pseudouridine(55) synthase TruB [Actinomycetaceae bacterium TAE3-ERU4]|nr:tRNA pseudouridine(55) synthase TruB [Actinomycetaceae bacterium TAE3-ERU4]